VTGIYVTDQGRGYTAPPVVTIAAPAPTTATGTVGVSGGAVVSVTITAKGGFYTTAPTVTFGGPGSGAVGTAIMQYGQVVRVQIDSPGTGYSSATVTFGAPAAGTQATATATLGGRGIWVGADAGDVWFDTPLHVAAGVAAVNGAPLKFATGVSLTTPEAGAVEFDGTAFFDTVDTTSGRSQQSNQQIFRLAANGSALGPTIADYFGSNSSFPTVTNGVYELTFYLYYLKTTAGTVTYTLTNTQAYTNLAAYVLQAPVGGLTSFVSVQGAGVAATTTAANALPVTQSLTTGVNHFAKIMATVECGTAGNIRLRVTSSAGTVTPLRGSYYTARRLFAGNVGTFAA
jgi:hypothetical protein